MTIHIIGMNFTIIGRHRKILEIILLSCMSILNPSKQTLKNLNVRSALNAFNSLFILATLRILLDFTDLALLTTLIIFYRKFEKALRSTIAKSN